MFSSGECPIKPLAAQPPGQTTVTSTSPGTTTYASIKDLDCTFEDDCRWTNATVEKFMTWGIVKALEGNSQFGGPAFDHTKNDATGSYLTPIILKHTPSTSVIFASPSMKGTKCIGFWYYITGSKIGTLSLSRLLSTSTYPTNMWTLNNWAENQWQFYQGQHAPFSANDVYTFRFEYKSGFDPMNVSS